jgi:hypothetical protein
VGDHVFLKVKERQNSLKFGDCSKLAARYYRCFEVLERIGPIAYMLELLASMCIHNVFHVPFLEKYVPYANNAIDWNVIHVEPKGEFKVHPVCILDNKIEQLRNRAIGIVKV